MTWNELNPQLKNYLLWGLILSKIVLFGYFTFEFNVFYEADKILNGFIIIGKDTPGYYDPAEDLALGNGYTSMCRMPGIVPVYNMFRLFFSEGLSKSFVVVTQFIFGIVAIWYFSRFVCELLKSKMAFILSIVILGLASYMSIWDSYLLSDSFANSAVMLATYFLWRYINQRNVLFLIFTSLLLSWAVFLRQINLVLFPPVFFLLAHYLKSFNMILRSAFLLALPLLLSIGSWTIHNYIKEKQIVPLVVPFSQCFKVNTEASMSIFHLVIAWGYDSQPWMEGETAHWFFQSDEQSLPPIAANRYTSDYNVDSIIDLRQHFRVFLSSTDPAVQAAEEAYIVERAARFQASYQANYPFDYWVKNRIGLTFQFIFPNRMSNLPYPVFEELNGVQFTFTTFNFFLILLTSACGILAVFVALFRKNWYMFFWMLIPWSIVVALTFIVGFIELRYLTPTFPFFILALAYVLKTLSLSFDFRRAKIRRLT